MSMSSAVGIGKTVINQEKAERRRVAAQAVRSGRAISVAATGSGDASFAYDLALTFAQNRVSSVLAIPVLAIIFAAAASFWVAPLRAALWALLVILVHFSVVALCRRFIALPAGQADTGQWTQRFILAELVNGIAWALILFVVARAQGTGLEIFQFAAMLVIVSVATMLASSIPAAVAAGTVPVTVTLVALYSSRGDFLFVALSVMALAALVFFLVLSNQLFASTRTLLQYRAEKDLLIAELETEKIVSDESRRRAEEANLAKSRFLATMSHELRTPLNAILGFSEMMKNEMIGPLENATYRDYVRDIHNSGQHLLNLINEILDLSRIEAGRYELNEEPVLLARIVGACTHLLQVKLRDKKIIVTEQFEDDLSCLWADERAVRQIVLNLLSNAIKFTPTGGEIALKVGWTAGGGQYVSIGDSGPGIAAEEIPLVMSSFGQGAIAIKNEEQGAGLGLPIVQALVRMHEGSFELKSRLDVGTEVIVCFPHTRVMDTAFERAGTNDGWLRTG